MGGGEGGVLELQVVSATDGTLDGRTAVVLISYRLGKGGGVLELQVVVATNGALDGRTAVVLITS